MTNRDLPASLGDASGCDEYFGEEDLTSCQPKSSHQYPLNNSTIPQKTQKNNTRGPNIPKEIAKSLKFPHPPPLINSIKSRYLTS